MTPSMQVVLTQIHLVTIMKLNILPGMLQSTSMVMKVTIDSSELTMSHINIFSAVKVMTSYKEVTKALMLVVVSFTSMEAMETTLLSLILTIMTKALSKS